MSQPQEVSRTDTAEAACTRANPKKAPTASSVSRRSDSEREVC